MVSAAVTAGGVAVAVTAGGAVADVGHSLREAFYMFWDTLWALAFGFTLSGAVQAFASREQMRKQLGSHGPAAVARASVYGVASSSCSYAAAAMSRSLFARGADFTASMVFMVASTNLVVELGIVLLVLVGWQFLAAEFVGGALMIVALAALGGLWFRGRALAEARATVGLDHDDGPQPHCAPHDAEHDHAGHDHAGHEHDPSSGDDAGDRGRIRTLAGWADAAGYTIGDLRMLRREMLVGFVVAGFLTELVPVHVWSDVFVHGHGFLTSLENVVVGPLVAVVSFVCSIGNVPLAAALWHGGSSFGGVVAFVFADLITLPLLLVYRKQYGVRMTLRMVVLLWPVMAAAGLVTEYLFRAAGAVPVPRGGAVVGDTLRWNATTALDIAALVLVAGLVVLVRARDRGRLGSERRFAVDPVCGMQVDIRAPGATTGTGEAAVYFCSGHCRDRFLARGEPVS